MTGTDRKLQQFLEREVKVNCSEERIQETIAGCEKAFCEEEAKGRLSAAEFLYQQAGYIQKRWWVMQGLLLFFLWMLLELVEGSLYLERCVGAAAPLFALLILPEMWKNRGCNALEIESASFYSLRQIYSARLTLFAFADAALLSIFFAASAHGGQIGLGALLVHFLIPFNVTSAICFRLMYSRRFVSESFALFLCMVWTFVWVRIVLSEAVYALITAPLWAGMLALSAGFLLYALRRGQADLKTMWEGKIVWN